MAASRKHIKKSLKVSAMVGNNATRLPIPLFFCNPPWGWKLADWDQKEWTTEQYVAMMENAKGLLYFFISRLYEISFFEKSISRLYDIPFCCVAMTHLEQFVFIVLVPGNLTGTVQGAFSGAGYYSSMRLSWQRRWGKPGNPFNPNKVRCCSQFDLHI